MPWAEMVGRCHSGAFVLVRGDFGDPQISDCLISAATVLAGTLVTKAADNQRVCR